jgi:large subunit ribosomal protein L30
MPENPKGSRTRKAKPAASRKSPAGERTRSSRSPAAKKRAGGTAGAAATRAKAVETPVAVEAVPADGEASKGLEPRQAAVGAGTITLQQYASGIGCPIRQKRVLRALGLRHPHHSVVRPDNPAVRGMVAAIRHLVRIVEGPDGRH